MLSSNPLKKVQKSSKKKSYGPKSFAHSIKFCVCLIPILLFWKTNCFIV
jgi:hypothetical protein